METLISKDNNDQNRINIINKINILIEKIDDLKISNNLTKIQKYYIEMLEDNKKILCDIINIIHLYDNYNVLEKYIKNKNEEINEFLINIEISSSYT